MRVKETDKKDARRGNIRFGNCEFYDKSVLALNFRFLILWKIGAVNVFSTNFT